MCACSLERRYIDKMNKVFSSETCASRTHSLMIDEGQAAFKIGVAYHFRTAATANFVCCGGE